MSSRQQFTFVNVSTPSETNNAGNKKRIRSAAAASGWAHGVRPQTKSKLRANSQHLHNNHNEPDHVESQLPPIEHRGILYHDRETLAQDHNPAPRVSTKGIINMVDPLDKPMPQRKSLADLNESAPSDKETKFANIKRKRDASRDRLFIPRKAPSLYPPSATPSLYSSWTTSSLCPSSAVSAVSSGPLTPSTPRSFSFRNGDLPLISPVLPSPHDLGSGSGDLFNSYPVPVQPWFHRILHHMLTVFAPRAWPTFKISNDEGLSWERFMTQHALAEPALFNVRLLFASGDLIRMNVLAPEISLYLRDQAVKTINEALGDPKRSVSEGLILAVGRIALHESLYGDRAAASLVHRPAQYRMIQMRGGMGALEIPELVKRLMRWGDRVMSIQADTPRFLPDEDQCFSLGQSVDALEKFHPQEGVSLRAKIEPTTD